MYAPRWAGMRYNSIKDWSLLVRPEHNRKIREHIFLKTCTINLSYFLSL